ncbi:MAG TPA: hypothetical protein DCW31_02220 [Lactobacillus sp.]|nr:hypothetical protein [Lactobacillus sp.]
MTGSNINQQLQLIHHQAVVTKADSERVIQATVSVLLRQYAVYGQLLVQLPREHVESQDDEALFGLSWRGSVLMLQVNDCQWQQARNQEQLELLLIHEALHLLWQHPLRYLQQKGQNVDIATDVAVNQALPGTLPNMWTLAALNQRLHTHLPANADSRLYLTALEHAHLGLADDGTVRTQSGSMDDASSTRKTQAALHAVADGQSHGKAFKILDRHDGWQTAEMDKGLAQANLQQQLNQVLTRTTAGQRGLLPSQVREQLGRVALQASKLPWSALFSKMVGSMTRDKQDTLARFNRRQPQRMALPGQVDRLVLNVGVFIDESASITAAETHRFVNEIYAIAKAYTATITIYPFDVNVHQEIAVRPNNINDLSSFTYRHIGGGTRFQSVFDMLQRQRTASSETLVIILTDGEGEAQLDVHGYSHVLWVLSGEQQLSVQPVPGVIARIED